MCDRYGRGFRFIAFAALVLAAAEPARARTASKAPELRGSIRQMQRLDAHDGWVLTDTALLVTADGGATWSDRTPERLDGISGLFFLDATQGWLAGVPPGSRDRLIVLESGNGFGSWREQLVDASRLSPGQSYAEARVHFVDPLNGWLLGRVATSAAVSVGELLRTTDGGATWERLPAPPVAGRFQFVDEKRGFMTGAPVSEKLYRTEDAGRSWQELALEGSAAPGMALYDLPVFRSAVDGTATVTLRGTRPRLLTFVTRDGGRSFEAAATLDLPRADYDEPVAAALDANGEPAAIALGGRLALGRGAEEGVSLARRAADRAPGIPDFAPAVRELAFGDDRVGWAIVTEGGCDTRGCRQTTRLVSVGGATDRAETQDLLVSSFESVPPAGPETAAVALGSTISTARGFDKCAAASVSQMQTWKTASPYKDANIYFGGVARGCSQPNLTAPWVKSVFQQGWRLIPTWVGPQAPCSSLSRKFSSDVPTARSQGLAEADAAIAAAAALGLGAGTPLYYDLEAYGGGGSCSAAVQSFVNAWTERIKARGYVSGIYGLPRNAQADWRAGIVANPADAVWLAYYACTGSSCAWTPRTTGIPGLSDAYWPSHQRIVQYWNSHSETYGGVTFTIDSNVADGPVATDTPPPVCSVAVAPERWKGEYFANTTLSGTPALVRDDGDQALAFDWGTASPGASCNVPADQFSVRWTRTVSVVSGRYRFTATTDDGVRLYVDGALKIDKWVDRGPTADVVDVDLAAGAHALRLEYYEATGGAVARLSWERTGDIPVGPIVVDDGPADAAGVLELLQTATGRPEWWHAETGVGHGGDLVWTMNTLSRKDNYARWKPKLPSAGAYKVEAFIPSGHATTTRAQYVIAAGGTSQTKAVNQSLLVNAWADLGTHSFRADGTEYVELADVTGEASNTKKVAFDAVRFTKALPPPAACQATVPTTRWKGEYFDNTGLTGAALLVRDDGDQGLNFEFGTGSPSPTCGLPADQFSARFSRTATFATPGTYRFTVTADDGVRLYVDGALALDKWVVQAPTTYTADVLLTAGSHSLRLEYFEATGGATLKLSWSLFAPAPVVVDDGDAGFLLLGPSQWWHPESGIGHGNDMVWTMNTQTRIDNSARWTPTLPVSGRYKVEAFIPSNHATTRQARYVITASGSSQTKTLSQNGLSNAWADLGIYAFRADGTEFVELADLTGEPSNTLKVAFDALRFTFTTDTPPPASVAWAFPVGDERTGAPWRVTLGLGQSWSSSTHQYNGHLAEDWSRGNNLGQPVYAAAAGEVITAVQNCGNYLDVIVLRHDELVDGERVYSMYGHIVTTLRVGERVERRQQLGVLGDPITFGPHLHFEVKTRTALVSPPFSSCANPAQSAYVSAGYSGRRGDYSGGDTWDPTDSVSGNIYFHPTRFIRKRLPAAPTGAAVPLPAEPIGPPEFPSADDGLPRCTDHP